MIIIDNIIIILTILPTSCQAQNVLYTLQEML